MSNVSPDQADFDFWEFVCCAKCRMPFALDNGGATVPFWLTECGHVICNSHLSLLHTELERTGSGGLKSSARS